MLWSEKMRNLLFLLVLLTGCASIKIPSDALGKAAAVQECVAIVSDCVSEVENAADEQNKAALLNACFTTINDSDCVAIAAEIAEDLYQAAK